MTYKTIGNLESAGFIGFRTIREMKNGGCALLPEKAGVYIIAMRKPQKPVFVPSGSGGFFKGKNPNVSISELESNWVDGTCVVYIGKATSLRKRLGQYMSFGSGNNVGHYGGRYIWQLKDVDDMLVGWKPIDENPRTDEADMIQGFVSQYGKRPFANLRD